MRRYVYLVLLLLGSILDAHTAPQALPKPTQAIVVTGASSGIGREIALTLSRGGFLVYAGARKPADIEALNRLPNIEGIQLDVTVQADIDQAVRTVQDGGLELFGLVNNAGVFVFDPLIEQSEEDLRFVMEVNVFGPYRVTKAFAPLIIQSQGRITTTGSLSGLFAGRLMGAYAMTKHAIEAFTDSLAVELSKFAVDVSVIEPGNFQSDIMRNTAQRLQRLAESDQPTRFGEEIQRFAAFRQADRSHHASPQPVADAVLEFMTTEAPKRRYMVTPNQREADYAIEQTLRRVVELNRGHAHSKEPADLVASLQQILDAETH